MPLYPNRVISLDMAAVVVGIAHTVDQVIDWLERTLGVNGAGLTVLFCVAVGVLVVLLMLVDRFSKRRAIRVAHAGRYLAPDPVHRRFNIHRSADEEHVVDPTTVGRARDSTNPRYRPDISLRDVPDPAFPTLAEVRKKAGQSGNILADLLGRLSKEESKVLGTDHAPLEAGSELIAANITLGASGESRLPAIDTSAANSQKEPVLVGHGFDLLLRPSSSQLPSGASPPPAPSAIDGFFATTAGLPVNELATAAVPVNSSTGADSAEISVGSNSLEETPVAGWYQDPDGAPGDLRYWDGGTWTECRPA